MRKATRYITLKDTFKVAMEIKEEYFVLGDEKDHESHDHHVPETKK